MGNFVAAWIAIQLVILASSTFSIHNKILDKSYKCVQQDKIDEVTTALVLPLLAFVNTSEVDEYCREQLND